jgi:predicted DNA-binding protein (UPF0251 family)
MGFRHRPRNGKKGRIPKAVNIARHLTIEGLAPLSKSARALYVGGARTIYIDAAEVEAQRLVDLEGLSQAEAGEKMGVSRGTVWRLLQAARKKVAQSLAESRPLLVLNEGNKRTSQKPSMSPELNRERYPTN